jgi:hypothetical protein
LQNRRIDAQRTDEQRRDVRCGLTSMLAGENHLLIFALAPPSGKAQFWRRSLSTGR